MKVYEKFSAKFPNSKVPPQWTINLIWEKQKNAFPVHDCHTQGGKGQPLLLRASTLFMLDRDCEKENDDPNFNSCRSNELWLSAATILRIFKHHDYIKWWGNLHHGWDGQLPESQCSWVFMGLGAWGLHLCWNDTIDGDAYYKLVHRYAWIEKD